MMNSDTKKIYRYDKEDNDSMECIVLEKIHGKAWKLIEMRDIKEVNDLAICLDKAIASKDVDSIILGNPGTTVITKSCNVVRQLLERVPDETVADKFSLEELTLI